MVYIIPNFLGLHFGENFMKILTNIHIAKLQMHENLHKNVNENMFLWMATEATSYIHGL